MTKQATRLEKADRWGNDTRTRRAMGCRRLLTFPTILAVSRLEREAKKRGTTVDLLAAKIFEILGTDDLYGAILDR